MDNLRFFESFMSPDTIWVWWGFTIIFVMLWLFVAAFEKRTLCFFFGALALISGAYALHRSNRITNAAKEYAQIKDRELAHTLKSNYQVTTDQTTGKVTIQAGVPLQYTPCIELEKQQTPELQSYLKGQDRNQALKFAGKTEQATSQVPPPKPTTLTYIKGTWALFKQAVRETIATTPPTTATTPSAPSH